MNKCWRITEINLFSIIFIVVGLIMCITEVVSWYVFILIVLSHIKIIGQWTHTWFY
jgi:hypothetical protein